MPELIPTRNAVAQVRSRVEPVLLQLPVVGPLYAQLAAFAARMAPPAQPA